MNLKDKIELITTEYANRIKNDIEITSWLAKQKVAIDILADGQREGLYLFEEALMEEREWITSILTNAG